jgi:hypothetical protein
MRTEDLQQALTEGVQMLSDNQRLVQPAMLDALEKLVPFLRTNVPEEQSAGGNLPDMLQAVIAHERTLLATDSEGKSLTDKIIGGIQRFQARPAIIAMVAWWL